MHCKVRLSAYLVLTVLVLVTGYAIRQCLFDNDPSPLQIVLEERNRREKLTIRQELLQRRTDIRHHAINAVIAGDMDLDTAATEFRRSDEGLEGIQPLDKEQSCRQVIRWVHLNLEERKFVKNRAEIMARLNRQYALLFGHPPLFTYEQEAMA
jgi:hypothetical protein